MRKKKYVIDACKISSCFVTGETVNRQWPDINKVSGGGEGGGVLREF